MKTVRQHALVPNNAAYLGSTYGGRMGEETADAIENAIDLLVYIDDRGEKHYFDLNS